MPQIYGGTDNNISSNAVYILFMRIKITPTLCLNTWVHTLSFNLPLILKGQPLFFLQNLITITVREKDGMVKSQHRTWKSRIKRLIQAVKGCLCLSPNNVNGSKGKTPSYEYIRGNYAADLLECWSNGTNLWVNVLTGSYHQKRWLTWVACSFFSKQKHD